MTTSLHLRSDQDPAPIRGCSGDRSHATRKPRSKKAGVNRPDRRSEKTEGVTMDYQQGFTSGPAL